MLLTHISPTFFTGSKPISNISWRSFWNIFDNLGLIGQPCFTPDMTKKFGERWPSIRNSLLCIRIGIHTFMTLYTGPDTPYFNNLSDNTSLFIVSKKIEKSTNTGYILALRLFTHDSYTPGPKFIELFSVCCQTHSKWKMWEIFEWGIKLEYLTLHMWNITYLVQVVRVQCSKTISNPSNSRCRPRSMSAKCENEQFRQFTESVIRLINLSSEIWNIRGLSAAVMFQCPKAMSKLSNLIRLIRLIKPKSASTLETGNAVMDTIGTILPSSAR